MKILSGVLILIAIYVSTLVSSFAATGMAVDPSDCLGCHESKISSKSFAASVHGKNGCTSCHVEATDLVEHMKGKTKFHKVQCVGCHEKEGMEHVTSVHIKNGVSCASCHNSIHTMTKPKELKQAVVSQCLQCHDQQKEYLSSTHGKAVLAGISKAAACNDCHGIHSIHPLGAPTTGESRKNFAQMCIKCHNDGKVMGGKATTEVVQSYLQSYHGKSFRLGYPERTAICSDCHTAHAVRPKGDPQSSINSTNLVKTCSRCHAKASILFTKFYAHGEHNNKREYPILYWTFLGMTALLVSVFAIFWIHTILWMFRGFVENRAKKTAAEAAHHCSDIIALGGFGGGSAGAATATHATAAESTAEYARFRPRHIVLHLTVIISFLGLSLTGLPLKFSDQPWAQTLMSFYGGVQYAGLIHRACAILTFYYFLMSLIMSVDFLIIKKDIKGNFFQRLFGPESLMPNFRDIKDVTAMVRWFLFRGPKPTFERWTYWEKFDFIAVFWGMFAIGGSGLMLWFPEFFTSLLPGWVLNVATIIHSDEALLATGFIFTVHFFNTHFRPEKFPMDFVIFNGRISREEFIHERGDQWKRYQQDGVLDQYLTKRPSGVLYDFVFKSFGFIALFTGLTLTVLMFFAFIS